MVSAAAAIALAISALPAIVAPVAQADCVKDNGTKLIGGTEQTTFPAGCFCPQGSVPAGTGDPGTVNCQAPVDQVRMKITTGGGKANVTITNLSTVAGTCAYQADDTAGILPSVHRDVDLREAGTATINDLLAPPLLSTYHVVLSCKGDFNGNQVEFGHVEQDVSSF
jgi:hypothetical protein